jgi:hypothetical protein
MRRCARAFKSSRMQSSSTLMSIHESDFDTPMRSAKSRKPSGVKPRRRAPTSVGILGSSQPSTSWCSTSSISLRFDRRHG